MKCGFRTRNWAKHLYTPFLLVTTTSVTIVPFSGWANKTQSNSVTACSPAANMRQRRAPDLTACAFPHHPQGWTWHANGDLPIKRNLACSHLHSEGSKKGPILCPLYPHLVPPQLVGPEGKDWQKGSLSVDWLMTSNVAYYPPPPPRKQKEKTSVSWEDQIPSFGYLD